MTKILSIDDSTAVHAFVTTMFDGLGTTLWHAYHGSEGLEMLDDCIQNGLELILLDWEMPGLSGIETLMKLRAKGVTVPIVMLTSKNSPEDIIQALAAGATEYVMKPFTKDILLEKLTQVLARKLI